MAYDPVDLHVGQVIRAKRKMHQLSQAELGESLGVSFQQVQKYERAANRVSCSMLWRVSHALKSEVREFFPNADLGGKMPGLGELAALASSRDGQTIGRCWREMGPAQRVALLDVALALAGVDRPVRPRPAAGDCQLDLEQAIEARSPSTIDAGG